MRDDGRGDASARAAAPASGEPPALPLSPAAEAAAAARPDARGAAILHASCVALEAEGPTGAPVFAAALILGPSGAGKSALALELISRGARLVADDRCRVQAGPGGLVASAPATLSGLIEARGVGLLSLPALPEAAPALVVDLSVPEPERLPPLRRLTLLGHALPLILSPSPAALHALLRAGGRRFAPR
ncbi:serine kinase [Albimonas sp. CAU 1670]|uniref:HPr kinase/phosphorylase n=1 Tax=Albimonas sp. CAU 1670 TaxID=3032599 RepID=UPI0023DA4B2B|nr:serine kinase [Albimonas sp. CAU 1670]MDF2233880.1 serine kinase [Albimonas sp. CAU 1670]